MPELTVLERIFCKDTITFMLKRNKLIIIIQKIYNTVVNKIYDKENGCDS